MLTDTQRAMLGDHEAAKRLTDAGVLVMQGDCLELLKDIPDGSVDMVLADLPYGVTDFKWDTVIPIEALFSQYRRVLKQNANIVLFSQQPFTTILMNGCFKSEFSHSLVWVKKHENESKIKQACSLVSI